MIHVPAIGKTRQFFLYADGEDRALIYVDEVQARPRSWTQSGGWLQLPDLQQSVFSGEVQFGFSGPLGSGEAVFLEKHAHTVAMPWEPSEVVAWPVVDDSESSIAEVPQILCRGKTSGYGVHNCVLQSRPCSGDVAGKAVIATTLLECPAVLAGGGLSAEMPGGEVAAAVRLLLDEQSAAVQLPLGYVLKKVLHMLLARKVGRVRVRSHAFSPAALEMVHECVVEEWAHRFVESTGDAGSLVRPAGTFSMEKARPDTDLTVRWEPGDRIMHRALRMYRFPAHLATCGQSRSTPAEKSGEAIELSVRGDWRSFDFADVCLRSGEREEHRTLRRGAPTTRLAAGALEPGKIQVTAVGSVSGIARKVPLVSRWASRNRMEIELPAIRQVAFLLKASREWLHGVGRLEISVSHPAAVQMLTPADATVRLDPDAGDLKTVSGVVRMLVLDSRAEEPFDFKIALGGGREFGWSVCPVNGDVWINDETLPVFRARCLQDGMPPVAVEVGVPDSGSGPVPGSVNSLGERQVSDSREVLSWILPNRSSALCLRKRFEFEGRQITTPWVEVPVEERSLCVVSSARGHTLFALALESAAEVEVLSERDEISSPYRATVDVQDRTTIPVLRTDPSMLFRARAREVSSREWSEWVTVSGRVIVVRNGRVVVPAAS